MITINLLPGEYRRHTRTPVKLMIGFTSAVTVNSLGVAWLAWLYFGAVAEVESEKSVLQLELDGLRPQVQYHKALDGERQKFHARETALATITKSRVSWTRKVDELIDVVNRGGEGARHFVWMDDLTVDQRVDARTGTHGTLRASGHSGSDNFAQVANFLEDLENSPFVQDFTPPAPPEGTQTLVDKELVPSVVWAFPLSLELKSPEDRQ